MDISLSKFQLIFHKTVIGAAGLYKRVMVAHLDHTSVVEHYNAIGIAHGRQAMGYHNHRASTA